MCYVLESWHLEKDDNASGEFPASYTDTFLNNLKCFFVEALVFPRVHMGRRFSLNIIRNFLHSGNLFITQSWKKIQGRIFYVLVM